MSLKKDKKRTSRIVLPYGARKKYSRKHVDFSGYDTKDGKTKNPRKIRTGPRGGHYVMVKGKKRYLHLKENKNKKK